MPRLILIALAAALHRTLQKPVFGPTRLSLCLIPIVRAPFSNTIGNLSLFNNPNKRQKKLWLRVLNCYSESQVLIVTPSSY